MTDLKNACVSTTPPRHECQGQDLNLRLAVIGHIGKTQGPL